MILYVVMHNFFYEWSYCVGVFSSYENAVAFLKKDLDPSFKQTSVDEWSTKTQSFSIETHILDSVE